MLLLIVVGDVPHELPHGVRDAFLRDRPGDGRRTAPESEHPLAAEAFLRIRLVAKDLAASCGQPSAAVIPERADQIANRRRKGSAGGRPVSYDTEQYKNCNAAERFFNRIKHWRGLASRFDKHALNYRGGVVLAAIVDWLKQS